MSKPQEIQNLEKTIQSLIININSRFDSVDRNFQEVNRKLYGLKELDRKVNMIIDQVAELMMMGTTNKDNIFIHTAEIGNLDMRLVKVEKKISRAKPS